MKSIYSIIFIFIMTFLVSCGENTITSPITDIKSLVINTKNISLYSTDSNLSTTATLIYKDNSTVSITDEIFWSSSDNNIFSVSKGQINIFTNSGGDANLSINHKQFSDYTTVHVNKLSSFYLVYPDINSSGTGTYIFSAKGTFDNNATDIPIQTNIIWSANNGAIVSPSNGVATITFISGDTNVTATMFGDTNSSSPTAPQTVSFKIN